MSEKNFTLPPAENPVARPAEQQIGTGIYFTPAPSSSQVSHNSGELDANQGTANVNNIAKNVLKSNYRAIWKSVERLEESGEKAGKGSALNEAQKRVGCPSELQLGPGIYFRPASSVTNTTHTEKRHGIPGPLAAGVSVTPPSASGSKSRNTINLDGSQNPSVVDDVTTDDLKAVCRAIWKSAHKSIRSDDLAQWLRLTASGDRQEGGRLPNYRIVNNEETVELEEEPCTILESTGDLEDSINIMLSAIAEDQVIVERNEQRMECLEAFLHLEPHDPPNVHDMTAEDLKAVCCAILKRAHKLEGSDNLPQWIITSAVNNQEIASRFPDILKVNDKTVDELEVEYRATLNSTYKLVESVNLLMVAIAEIMATLERINEQLKSDEVLSQSQLQTKNSRGDAINSSSVAVQTGSPGTEESAASGLHL